MFPKHKYYGLRPWSRHGVVLIVSGLAYIGTGLSYTFAPNSASRVKSLDVAISWMPLEYWGWVFVFVGALAVVSSRWPPVSRIWGYTLLTGMSAAWAAFYATGIFVGGSKVPHLSGAFIWGLLAFMWWAISGLLNPEDTEEEEWMRLP